MGSAPGPFAMRQTEEAKLANRKPTIPTLEADLI
jgi:hypothetical protein